MAGAGALVDLPPSGALLAPEERGPVQHAAAPYTAGGSAKGRPSNATLADAVRALGGTRVIRSVLVANNGIAAVKFIRSVRCGHH